MTTCIPTKPFRCWQFLEGEPVPAWAGHMRKEWSRPGWWLVEVSIMGSAPRCYWYTPAEFAERFRIEDAVCPHCRQVPHCACPKVTP
jgi:hypothetical protein